MSTSPRRQMALGSVIVGGVESCLRLDLQDGGHGTLSVDSIDILCLRE